MRVMRSQIDRAYLVPMAISDSETLDYRSPEFVLFFGGSYSICIVIVFRMVHGRMCFRPCFSYQTKPAQKTSNLRKRSAQDGTSGRDDSFFACWVARLSLFFILHWSVTSQLSPLPPPVCEKDATEHEGRYNKHDEPWMRNEPQDNRDVSFVPSTAGAVAEE